jgi:hypothetical protein
MPASGSSDGPALSRIPADVDQPDRVLGPLTIRQVVLLGVLGLLVWGGFRLSHGLMEPVAYLALVAPLAALGVVVVLARRDGLPGDRFVLAALRHARAPKHLAADPAAVPDLPDFVPGAWTSQAPPSPSCLDLPATGIDAAGTIDLAGHGQAVLATCSTVNFGLRTPIEQQALTGAFARWLNALSGPAQLLVRADRMDLAEAIDALLQAAPNLPHPALEDAARGHAGFLAGLDAQRDLLTRQCLLVLREPPPPGKRRAATSGRARLGHRTADAVRSLAGCEVTVTSINGPAAVRTITAACDPHATPRPAPGAPITASPPSTADTQGVPR